MVVYNFKKITTVPTAKDFIDIVLSATQRRTPTEVHKQFAVSRIRSFYMRKVKFAQQTFHDRLTLILEEFPVLDDLHPFYADLLNILYDKDHYKLALGQLATARRLIDNLAQEHVRFLKYGDSLYRCKQLKRAALGRMCTIIKHQSASLAYLEQVRQHLGRLPSIDPSSRTLICTGFPNVGKSSMLNCLTKADVDVQPYAFTTKSLYVGHIDYEHLRWQVLDTPGILDHALDQRNTIEMQSITALAHLRAAILFVLDISETCGHTIEQQLALFDSIRPLFAGKPLVVALNKIDLVREADLPPETRKLFDALRKQGVTLAEMSTLTGEGVDDVKKMACDSLLAQRTEERLAGAKAQSILTRLHVAVPQQRDTMQRAPCIPHTVIAERAAKAEKERQGGGMAAVRELTPAEREIEQERRDLEMLERGENPWSDWLKDHEKYFLEKEEWKKDVIPEIIDGMNIADFIDPDIVSKLEALEREEDMLVAQAAADGLFDESDDEDKEMEKRAEEVFAKRMLKATENRIAKKGEARRMAKKTAAPRTAEDLQKYLMSLGIDPALASEAAKSAAAKATATASSTIRKRGRDLAVKRARDQEMDSDDEDEEDEMNDGGRVGRARERRRGGSDDEEGEEEELDEDEMEAGLSRKAKRRALSMSRSRSRSAPRPMSMSAISKLAQRETSITGETDTRRAEKLKKVAHSKLRREGRKGEADRRVFNMMPKHLFSGKRKNGTHDRR